MQNTAKHVAIVMDGNGRWATERNLPRIAGHKAGVDAIREIIKAAKKYQVEVLSLFAFSTENWSRPSEEVNYLMELFIEGLQQEVPKLHKNHICLRFIGDFSQLRKEIRQGIQDAEALTAKNDGPTLVIAINYGGQWDIVQAARKFAKTPSLDSFTDEQAKAQFAEHICIADLPPVDLFIRTSGEMRISNFFLWQLAYAELYFTDIFWPDFNEEEFAKALDAFAKRQRRFGGRSEIKNRE